MKMNSFLYDLIVSRKVYIILGLFFILGVLIINYSQDGVNINIEEKAVKTSADTVDTFSENTQSLEYKLKRILTQVDGVGDVDVFINYNRNKESVSSSILFNNNNSKMDDVSIVEGIIVVAQGGDDAQIISLIRNSVSESFGIPLHKVIVLKMSE